jgi:hypothetical protein
MKAEMFRCAYPKCKKLPLFHVFAIANSELGLCEKHSGQLLAELFKAKVEVEKKWLKFGEDLRK